MVKINTYIQILSKNTLICQMYKLVDEWLDVRLHGRLSGWVSGCCYWMDGFGRMWLRR